MVDLLVRQGMDETLYEKQKKPKNNDEWNTSSWEQLVPLNYPVDNALYNVLDKDSLDF